MNRRGRVVIYRIHDGHLTRLSGEGIKCAVFDRCRIPPDTASQATCPTPMWADMRDSATLRFCAVITVRTPPNDSIRSGIGSDRFAVVRPLVSCGVVRGMPMTTGFVSHFGGQVRAAGPDVRAA